ncbi:unnamed protein product [Prorocentrum cordatum]|nr:unnamed protein product [Polarella glacialis]
MADEVKARWARGYYSEEFLTALRWPGTPLLSRPLPSSKSRPIVAMHVRRGDMSLGCERCRDRTTPDGWNLWALRRILRALPGADVHVFSSLEGRHAPAEFDNGYREIGASVHLDDVEILTPWTYFARADLVVLARSSFSWAPAMLNPSCVVFQKNPRLAPLPGWIEARHQWEAEETWPEGLDDQTPGGLRRPSGAGPGRGALTAARGRPPPREVPRLARRSAGSGLRRLPRSAASVRPCSGARAHRLRYSTCFVSELCRFASCASVLSA